MSDEPLTPSAGSEASDVGEDEERQKTDEERLLEEIAKQKVLIDAASELIDAASGDDTCEGVAHSVPHEKKLGQLEFKYQLLVEKKRLAGELLKFQELYGDLYSEPCLICLEDIHVYASVNLTTFLYCCGGFVCTSCVRDIVESGVGLDKCPLCRESLQVKSEAYSGTIDDIGEEGRHLGPIQCGSVHDKWKERVSKAGKDWTGVDQQGSG